MDGVVGGGGAGFEWKKEFSGKISRHVANSSLSVDEENVLLL